MTKSLIAAAAMLLAAPAHSATVYHFQAVLAEVALGETDFSSYGRGGPESDFYFTYQPQGRLSLTSDNDGRDMIYGAGRIGGRIRGYVAVSPFVDGHGSVTCHIGDFDCSFNYGPWYGDEWTGDMYEHFGISFGDVRMSIDVGDGYGSDRYGSFYWTDGMLAEFRIKNFRTLEGCQYGSLRGRCGAQGVSAVPLPAALPLMASALGGLGLMRPRRKTA